MGVSLEIYRAAIGFFNSCRFVTSRHTFELPLFFIIAFWHIVVLLALFFLFCCDVELNPGPNRTCSLNIGHLNVRSLNVVEKFEEVATIIMQQQFHIFGLTETWLNSSISNDAFRIPGYYPLVRLDRPHGRRGGVAFYVSSSVGFKRRHDLEVNDLELLWIELKLNRIVFLCGVCYKPPCQDSVINLKFLENLQLSLDKVSQQPNSFLTLIGDFNASYDPSNPLVRNDFGALLYRWMECNNLYQVINEPTRITQYSESLLDLIITNCPGYFVNCGTLSPPANCDHSLIFARLNISVSKPKCYNRRIWQFNDVNEAELCNELAHFDWDAEVFRNLYDINAIYSCWFKHFHDIVKTKIPSRIVMIRPCDKPWMDSSVRLAMRKRDRLLKLYCKYKTRPSWEKYRQQRNLTTTLIRKNKAKYFHKVNAKLQDVTTGVKAW